MEDNVSSFLGKLTELVEQLKDTKTGEANSADHPGIIKNAFSKSKSQEKSDDNSNLAESIAEANAEHRKEEEETKGRRIIKTVMPMSISAIDPKAVKQLKSVLGSDKSTITGKGPDVKESEGMFGWLLGLLPMLGTIGTVVMAVISGIGTVITTIFGIIAGPVGLVLLAVAAIAAFFVGFWEEWEETGDFGASMIAGVGKIFDWLIALPLTLLKDLTTWAMRKMGFGEEADFIDEHWDAFLAKLKELFLGPITIWVDAFKNVWDGITQIWDGITGIFEGIGALLTGDFEKAGELFKTSFGNIINGIWDFLWAIPNAVINWVFEFLGFKEEGDEDFNLGDMLWDTISAVFDWFKLLFTSPAEAFKKIGDWFDRLFDDPVGAFKELMPAWLVDFGVWIWDHTFGPIVDLWNDICGDPEGAKEAFLNLMPEWLRDIAEWIWDRTIGPAVELWNYIFGHPDGAKAAFKSLFPEWLWDIMEWIYDHTLGPIVNIFSDLFDGKDMETTFRKYLPGWLVDTFLWVKDNVFGPITDFFGHLFSGDIEEALRAILPGWLVDFFGWIWNNLFAPIGDFFSALFDGDLVGAFKAILPDWLLDFFGWIGDNIFGPIGDWFSDQWETLTNVGKIIKNKIKEEYPLVYDWIWGDEEEFAAAAEAEKKALTGELKSKVSDNDAITAIVEETQAAGVAAGGDTYADRTEDLYDNMRDAVSDAEGSSSKLLKELSSSDENKILDYASRVEGLDLSDQAAVDKFWNKIAGGYEDVLGTMNTSKGADNYMNSIANTSAGLQLGDAKKTAGIDELMKYFAKTKEAQLGGMIIPLDIEEQTMFGMTFGVPMVKKDQVLNSKMLDAWDVLATSDKLSDKLYMGALERMGLKNLVDLYKSGEREIGTSPGDEGSSGDLDSLLTPKPAAYDVNNRPKRPKNLPKPKTLGDFILRPGMDPIAFDKGDILLGIHKDNPPATTNTSPALINRVDQMVVTLRENKDIQAKMLEALIASGLLKKQGNTVVNSGGNSTVVNNTTTQSSIMSFRDKVVGRISNSSTKY